MKITPLLLCIIVAFCVGALTTSFQREEQPPSPAEESDSYIIDFPNLGAPLLFILWIMVVIVSLSGGKLRKKPLVEEISWEDIIKASLLMGAFAFIFFFFLTRRKFEFKYVFKIRNPGNLNFPSDGFFAVRPPTTTETALILLGSLVLILVIALLVVFFARILQKNPLKTGSFLSRLEDEQKRSFSLEGSPRDVVINAYGASCQHLETRGFPNKKYKTPAEFREDVHNPHLDQLTDLFEEARYSDHDMTNQDSETAVSSYRRLRDGP